MSDMDDTRRLHGGGAEREPDEVKPASVAPVKAPDNGQLAWLEGECKFLRFQTQHVHDAMMERWVWSIVAAFVILFISLITAWGHHAVLKERIQAERDATTEELKKVHDALYHMDENRKVVVTALGPEAIDDDHELWTIVEAFDDLRVVHVRYDDETYERRHPLRLSPRPRVPLPDEYIHLSAVEYGYVKRQGLGYVYLDARRAGFYGAAEREVASLETLRKFDHAAIVEYHDAQRLIGIRHYMGEYRSYKPMPYFDWDFSGIHLMQHIEGYLHLDDVTYALVRGMETLDVRALEDAHRNR